MSGSFSQDEPCASLIPNPWENRSVERRLHRCSLRPAATTSTRELPSLEELCIRTLVRNPWLLNRRWRMTFSVVFSNPEWRIDGIICFFVICRKCPGVLGRGNVSGNPKTADESDKTYTSLGDRIQKYRAWSSCGVSISGSSQNTVMSRTVLVLCIFWVQSFESLWCTCGYHH